MYRADDMKLGQAVALKFLPADLQRDSSMLARFHHEVRIARQVSHPNVCRVYDIAEADGQHFISMEYVDGEDLKSLLRRIGRLPEDKALQIARQMCAGLAAAHDKGVLHRDLKPANIMLDGEGRVRITDFGLAAIASEISGADLRSGTPGYMAPEQLAGRDVSVASDIYSLGLVLFELFTGKPAFKAASIAELRTQQESGVTAVQGIDRSVERVVLSCLARHPAERPSSALAVAASLPGGDPLAAALAAGETPSPEVVAASVIAGTITPRAAALSLAAIVVALVVIVRFGGGTQITSYAPLPHEPQVLTAKTQELLRNAGVTDPPRDFLWGFERNARYIAHLRRADDANRWSRFGAGVHTPIYYFYRQSPRDLLPNNPASYRMKLADPPAIQPGTATVWTDTSGQLMRLEVVTPERHDAASGEPAPSVDWTALFTAAGLSNVARREAAPLWNPPFHSDARAAWEIDSASEGAPALRVEAASYQGRPVSFRVIGPWEQPAETSASEEVSAALLLIPLVFLIVMATGFVLARRNIRLGRSDTRGAFRLVSLFVAMHILGWLLFTKYAPGIGFQFGALMATMAVTLFEGLVLYMLYLALEPFVRRRWPDTLVSWTRALSGRLRDPLIGRDVLFGCVIGLAMYLIYLGGQLIAARMGLAEPRAVDLTRLTGTRFLFGEFIDSQSHAALLPMGVLIVPVLFAMMVRRGWLATLLAVILIAGLETLGTPSARLIPITAVVALAGWWILVATLTRLGLLAATISTAVYHTMAGAVVTTNLSAWYATGTIVAVMWTLLLAGYGAHTALAGRPVFGTAWLEED